MIRSIELVLDPETDAAVRADWLALRDAGLPSLADHTGETNRPHVTVVAGPEPFADSPVDLPVGVTLPMPVRLGGLLVFGAGHPRGVVLSRAVVPSAKLLALHAAVSAEAGGDPQPTSRPGAWTPHVTLSRRLPVEALPSALAVLDGLEREGAAVGLRLWDPTTRSITVLAGGG